MARTVSAPLVIARREDGSDVYLYVGAPLPAGLAEGEEKRLDEGGFLAKVVEEVESEEEAEKPAPKSSK